MHSFSLCSHTTISSEAHTGAVTAATLPLRSGSDACSTQPSAAAEEKQLTRWDALAEKAVTPGFERSPLRVLAALRSLTQLLLSSSSTGRISSNSSVSATAMARSPPELLAAPEPVPAASVADEANRHWQHQWQAQLCRRLLSLSHGHMRGGRYSLPALLELSQCYSHIQAYDLADAEIGERDRQQPQFSVGRTGDSLLVSWAATLLQQLLRQVPHASAGYFCMLLQVW
jgi:hypothetical protein